MAQQVFIQLNNWQMKDCPIFFFKFMLELEIPKNKTYSFMSIKMKYIGKKKKLYNLHKAQSDLQSPLKQITGDYFWSDQAIFGLDKVLFP